MASCTVSGITCAVAVCLCAGRVTAGAYIHNVYFTARTPSMARAGGWVFDISSRERMADMLGELAAIGTNAVTYHSAYRADGADYTPGHAKLRRSARWPPDATPIDWFLDICAGNGMDGYLGVFIFPEMDVELAELASEDIATVFHGRRGMIGFVPPIEGSPLRGLGTPRFLRICSRVKEIAGLQVMDYPNGPFSSAIVQTIVTRAASGTIDVENIQFHAADDRLGNFVVTRGMTHLVMGMCSRSRSIVHTHYKYGGGKAWLKEPDAYRVRQGAVLTATPDGTSIFSFQHGFWGEETGPGTGSALWRRLAWYEGILAVQRMVPVLAGARQRADAAVIIPAKTVAGGLELVERYWVPLARSRGNARTFVYAEQLVERPAVIVCPSLAACDSRQRRELAELTREGALLLLPQPPVRAEAGPLSARARRILAIAELPPIEGPELPASFVDAVGGVGDDGRLPPTLSRSERPYAKGAVVAVPAGLAAYRSAITDIVVPRSNPLVQASGLPDACLAELWRTGDSCGGVQFAMFLRTEPGDPVAGGAVSVELDGQVPRRAWWLDRSAALSLPVERDEGRARVRLPQMNDEYGIVLFGGTPHPVLRPAAVRVDAGAGGTAALSCRLVNTTEETVVGRLEARVPAGWQLLGTGARDYRLAPGAAEQLTVRVELPDDVECRPYVVAFHAGSALQRTIVVPHDGRPQVVSRQPLPAPRVRRSTVRPAATLGAEWVSVVAGDSGYKRVRGRVPGVAFYAKNDEWDGAEPHAGRPACYGEVLPRIGGPNFYVTDPAPDAPLDVRITYRSKTPGELRVYDGKRYHSVMRLPGADDWRTAIGQVPAALLRDGGVDMSRTDPGKNVMFEVRVDGVHVHRIDARSLVE